MRKSYALESTSGPGPEYLLGARPLFFAMQLTTNGHPLDTSPDRFGELVDATTLLGDAAALREALAERGYLFFRGLLDPDRDRRGAPRDPHQVRDSR